MKLLLIFAAVLLSAVTAKVTPTSVDQVHKGNDVVPAPVLEQVSHVQQQPPLVQEDRKDKATKMDGVKVVSPLMTSVVGVVNKDTSSTGVINKKQVVPPLGPVVVPPVVDPVVPPIHTVDAKMAELMKPTVMPAVAVPTPVKVPLVMDPLVLRKTRQAVLVPEMPKKPVKEPTKLPVVPKVPVAVDPKMPVVLKMEAPKVPLAEAPKVPLVEAPKVPLVEAPKVPHVSKVPLAEMSKVPPTVPAVVMPAVRAMPMPMPVPMPMPMPMPMVTKAPVGMRRRRAIEMPVVVAMPGITQMKMDAMKCDMQCTKLDLNPICASNGECLHEFPNQCVMDTFNCVRPELGFKATKDNRCEMHWLKRCTEQQLMG